MCMCVCAQFIGLTLYQKFGQQQSELGACIEFPATG